MSTSVTWKNAPRFKKKLGLLPHAVAEAARSGMEEQAQDIVGAMKRLVPVETGALRDSIVYAVPALGEKNDSRVTITAGDRRAWYARLVEFGTVKMRARPFFFVTFRSMKRLARSRVSRKASAAIKVLAAE